MACNDTDRNGHPLTLAALAEAKRLPIAFLRSVGVEDIPGGGVAVPYYDTGGTEVYRRERDRPGGPRFRQPAGVQLRPYGLWRLDAARRVGHAYLTEGESDTWALWHHGLPDLGLPGSNTAKVLEAEHLAGLDTLYLLPDADPGGERMAEGVARRLVDLCWGGRLFRVRLPDGVKDASDWHVRDPERFAGELAVAVEHAQPVGLPGAKSRLADASPEQATPGLVTTCLADVRPQPLRWLVPGYLPLGKLVLIAGDGGHGKSSLTLHLAAVLSRGRPAFGLAYPGALSGETLLIQCEDDAADTVVPRLLAAGADLSCVHQLEGTRGADGKVAPFCLAHYRQLEEELQRRPRVRLVVIDPAGAYVSPSGVDDHKDSELRALLGPLAVLAARRRVTVLLVKHLVKGATDKAVHRVSGSAGYVNSVRAAFVVAPEPDRPECKLFLPLKFNLGPRPAGLGFRLHALEGEEQRAVLSAYGAHLGDEDRAQLAQQLFRTEWSGAVEDTADAVFAAARRGDRDQSKVEKAAAWLEQFLGGLAYPSEEITAAGKAAGFTFDNIKEAKVRLKAKGLRSSNRGRFQGEWWTGFGDPDGWSLRPAPGAPHTPHTPRYGANEGEKAPGAPRVGSPGREGSEGAPSPGPDYYPGGVDPFPNE